MMYFILFTCILWVGPVQASLMFSPQEIKSILEKRTKNGEREAVKKSDSLTCNGIVFQSATRWSIWLNGRKITSKPCTGCPQNITIISVTPETVSLIWEYKTEKHPVTLHTNHSYNSTFKKVIKHQ